MYPSLQNSQVQISESDLEFVAYQKSANVRVYAAGSNFGTIPAERLRRTCRSELRAQNKAEKDR